MPQTRYIEVYTDGVLIDKEAYEVSDEDLAQEQKEKRMANILDELDELKVKVKKLEDRV